MGFLLELSTVTAVAIGLLWGCGLLVARFLLPWRYRPFLPLVAPFLGLALMSAGCHYLGAAGLSLRPMRWLFVGLAVAGWAFALLDRRLRRIPRSALPALAICLLAFLLAISPLFSLGYLTVLGTSVDAVFYAAHSEYLQEAPLRTPGLEPGKPWLAWVASQFGIRAGDTYFVGLVGLLTGSRSYELLSLVPALFFALTAGAVFVWARGSLRLHRGPALLAAALTGLSNLLLCVLYENFLSQSVGLGFVPLLYCFGVEGQRRPGWRMAALFGVLLVTLVSVYPVFAAFALAGVLCSWGVGALRQGALARTARWWLGAAAVAAAWNGVALVRAGRELGYISQVLDSGGVTRVGHGGIVVFPPVIEALGLIAHVSAAYFGNAWPRVPLPILMALGLGFGGLAAYGWWRLSRRARLAAAALFLTGAALAALQRWGVNPPHGYPYGWFKAISALTPQVLVLVAAGIGALWRLRSRRWIAAGAALLLLAINAKHALWTVSFMRQHRLVVSRELIEAADAAGRLDPGAWLEIDLPKSLRQHWLGILLRDRRIRYREPLWVAHVETPRTADAFVRHALVERGSVAPGEAGSLDEPWRRPGGSSRVWANSGLELLERRDSTLASVRWRAAWPEAAALELGIAPARSAVTVRLGPMSREGGLGPGKPRTLQVRVFSLAEAGRIEVPGIAGPVSLPPGGWLLDLDLGCLSGNRIEVSHAAGEAILADLRLLGTATGEPGECLETVPLPDGVASFEQKVLEGGERVRLTASVLRPADATEDTHRLGLHVVSLEQHKLLGGWSLDFPPGARLRRGSLVIDLRDHAAQAEVDGQPATPLTGSFDNRPGSFKVDAVWWRLPEEQLQTLPILWYRRAGDGSVAVKDAAQQRKVGILPSP